MIKEEKIEFTAKWCKYNKYKIKKRDNKLFIIPDKNSVPSTYNPFDYINEILRDLLMIGKKVSENNTVNINNNSLKYDVISKIDSFQNLILDFATNYGLLGNFRYLPENYDFMDNPKLPVKLGYNESMPSNKFEQIYFGFDKSIDWSKEDFSFPYIKYSEFNAEFKQTVTDRMDDIIFSKYYSEPISEILQFADTIYDFKHLIYDFYYDNSLDDVKEMYEGIINAKTINRAEFGYAIEDGNIKFKWKFNSLRAIIEIMLLLNETNGRNEVKLCKYCGKPFIAKNIKSEYDTLQCRNKANIYISRNNKK